MKTANVSRLKARLSAYLQAVQDGEEVLVCDRNKPVARIVPCRLSDRAAQQRRLVARGVLTPPLKNHQRPGWNRRGMFPTKLWRSVAGRARRPLGLVSAFWDASALIPLCVRQSLTPSAAGFYKTYDVVAWWATPMEIASALARLLRMGQITAGESAAATRIAGTLADSWAMISDSLRAAVIQLVDRYELRAGDALQLAAALQWCEDLPAGRVFLAADQKLRAAALAAAFDARQM